MLLLEPDEPASAFSSNEALCLSNPFKILKNVLLINNSQNRIIFTWLQSLLIGQKIHIMLSNLVNQSGIIYCPNSNRYYQCILFTQYIDLTLNKDKQMTNVS